jgi:GTP pyrophosphokinase
MPVIPAAAVFHAAANDHLLPSSAPEPLSGADAALVRKALDYVAPLYAGRRLRTGEAALVHAEETAAILGSMRLGPEPVAAALLCHALDLAPDAATRVRETFGERVSELAEGVVRMDQMGALSARRPASSKETQQAAQLEALRKMLLAMVQDVRVVLIKLADRTQELRFLASNDAPEDMRRESAELTRDIFAPLANRLGVWSLKWELEDLAFRILEPDMYRRIAALVDETRNERATYIDGVMAQLAAELKRAGIAADISGRPKHIYSIHRKMTRKGLDFEALHDVRAVRVLVDDVKDCYAALGVVHNLWSPVPKEFDDYIAKPKSNNYRSLHTAVIGPEGKAVEVQIRTHDMHQHSELGVAAHWRYKESSRRDRSYDEKIAWLRQILEWKDEVADAGDLAEQFKTGLFADTVYVLTPQGRVIDLPQGATPVDFAYHVHTELGHRCRGAKVDGVMVPLNTPLKNGQQVEIMAAKHGGPSRDWLMPALGFLKSPAARTRVRQWFNRQNYESEVAEGRLILDKELHRHGAERHNLEHLAGALGYSKVNDFLAGIGRGEIGPKLLLDALRAGDEPAAEPAEEPVLKPRQRAAGTGSVLIVGVDKLLTVTARCCKPVPPDAIVGFVTRGRGVTVHRADCANVARLEQARHISAEWGASHAAVYPVDIVIEATDRTGLLRDLSEVFVRERINVIATATASAKLVARMRFTLEVTDAGQLARVLGFVREIRGVLGAARR